MARQRLTFRERDVTAAIRAIEKTGHKVARVSINQDGSIIMELAPPAGRETVPVFDNPWDEAVPDDYWHKRLKGQ